MNTLRNPGRIGGLPLLALLLVTSPSIASNEDPHEPLGAEGIHAESATVPIPEPLAFDLVRGLGARKGELEANVLALVPFADSARPYTHWAPEIEYAVLDNLALEFELPFEGSELEGYKFAGQYTFGTALDNRYIHGTQVIAEYVDQPDLWELTFLYLPGMRFDEVWSALLMLGLRTEVGDETGNETELLTNVNVFAGVGPEVSLGLEMDYAAGRHDDEELLVLPQVHWEVTDHFMIQLGVGAEIHHGGTDGTAAIRAILEF